MPFRLFRRFRAASQCGFLAAALALASQLALGAVVPRDEAAASRLAALDALSIVCAGGQSSGQGQTTPHHRRAVDPALCPLGVALALPAYVLGVPPIVPAPPSVLALRTQYRPPGRGPPPATARVGAPRAPPAIG